MSMPSNASGQAALAPSLLSDGNARTLQEVLLVLIGTGLITLAGKISVPFYPVPMTLQTFAVMAIAASFGMRLGVATVLAYLAEGALGLPVFTSTPPLPAGPAYFLGTTGGFLAGFVVLAFIVGAAADRGWGRSLPKMLLAMIVADVIVFAMGFVWLAGFATLSPRLLEILALPAGSTGAGVSFAWAQGVVPFVLGDLLKIALAATLVAAGTAIADRRLRG